MTCAFSTSPANGCGAHLPQRGIEVSRLYHDHLYRRYPDAAIDLHLAAICRHLALPAPSPHDALSDAVTAALVFVRLHQAARWLIPKSNCSEITFNSHFAYMDSRAVR